MRRNRAHCSVVWKEGVVGWVDVFDVDLSPLPSVCGGGRGGGRGRQWKGSTVITT